MTRSTGMNGDFVKESLISTQATFNLPLDPFRAPIQSNQPHSVIEVISNNLFHQNIRMRELVEDFTPNTSLASTLSIPEYNNHYKVLYSYRRSFQFFKDIIKTGSNPLMTKSFNFQFATKRKLIRKPNPLLLPRNHKCRIIPNVADLDHNSSRALKPFTIRPTTNSLNSLANLTIVHVWTDGSLKSSENDNMGCGIVYEDPTNNIFIDRQTLRATNTNPSSTKPEVLAILASSQACHLHQTIVIHSDSQVALSNIQKINTSNLTQNKLLKISNYPIYEAIRERFNQFDYPPEFRKVLAHSGIPGNEEADCLADTARQLLVTTDIPQLKSGKERVRDLHLYHNSTRIDYNIREFLTKSTNILAIAANNERILRVNQTILNGEVPDLKLIKTAIGISAQKSHHLDASYHKTETFYTNVIQRNPQVLEKCILYKNIFFIKRATCRNCFRKIEDQDHIWKCRNTISAYQEILEEARNFITPNLQMQIKLKQLEIVSAHILQ